MDIIFSIEGAKILFGLLKAQAFKMNFLEFVLAFYSELALVVKDG
jgi:hypothetical protein